MATVTVQPIPNPSLVRARASAAPVSVRGEGLTITDVVRVAHHGSRVLLVDDSDILKRVLALCESVTQAVEASQAMYGVTTRFGGMANRAIASII